ncbi:peptidoglycan-binding protein [Ponticoccus sp. SC2-23]|nr:peptidoglycan-binding protein [Ponticoccus sp. SC6-9]MBM1225427.1 peptidoglycan-binding protein [Ponticoccus sp. SC6-15]MBM1227610.1 peptidoglycan-binding protein [Ponticoccus sp. SC6-38]MBM1234752.1 peptidoglycan-binding protein [Ponticoccus sp. SC6-45]MBM1238112.1 peptidoglycan-binding protein [Ponticoccus sp. SC6-49]MBM1244255.1 peptidoglycan-binding protein [Ponticoccus sp. SC2-64]MBM1248276.1 peptidoglycan-binding protein [Ponticoccus sp. SC6-42]MBM1252512.1 peptidoglycan-binding pro
MARTKANRTEAPLSRVQPVTFAFFAGFLAACSTQLPPVEAPNVPSFIAAEIEAGEDGRCYGRDITPAIIETLTEQVLVQQATYDEDGTLLSPARYESAIRQQITREREEVAFETLCPPAYTEVFVASLQRALRARGFYGGEITGVMDTATGRAVQDYQRRDGPDSPLLWIAAARELGLVELSDEQIEALNASPFGTGP